MPDESPDRARPSLPTLDNLPRPVTDAPHDRHFADGEEPPERYDRLDEIEYVLPREYTLDSNKYFRVARKHYRHCRNEFALMALMYYALAFAGGMCVGLMYAIVLDPPLRAGLTIFALGQLTGKRKRYGTFFSGFQHIGRLVVCMLPLVGLQLVTILVFELGMLGSIAAKQYWAVPLVAVMATFGLSLYVFLAIRLVGFAFELICDHRFDAVQAFRGTWMLSRGHFWGLFWLAARLWLLELVVGICTCGIGLIWLTPFNELVWVAAYLDIAGSEELIEDPDAVTEATEVAPVTEPQAKPIELP